MPKRKNSEALKAGRIRWKKNNPEKYAWFQIKSTFKRKGIEIGISYDGYMLLRKRQNDLCAICQKSGNSLRTKRLCVDHDHKTGKIRGLLCGNCNRALGLFGDDRDGISKALRYLEQSKETINFLAGLLK